MRKHDLLFSVAVGIKLIVYQSQLITHETAITYLTTGFPHNFQNQIPRHSMTFP